MSITKQDFDDKLHRIKIRLYRNFLSAAKGKSEGKYFARTASEDSLNLEDICSMMKTRGGFEGDYAVLLENLKCFFREVAYNVCDGYTVNTGYFSIYPNIGGTFDSAKEPFNPQKHKISFRYRTNRELRKLIKKIEVEVSGVSDSRTFIYQYVDHDEESLNGLFVPGNMFTLTGRKIKVEGDDPSCGVFFVPVDDPSKAVRATRLAENSAAKIIGIAPDTGSPQNRIEIRTQYSGSKEKPLKEPRVITSDFVLEAA